MDGLVAVPGRLMSRCEMQHIGAHPLGTTDLGWHRRETGLNLLDGQLLAAEQSIRQAGCIAR